MLSIGELPAHSSNNKGRQTAAHACTLATCATGGVAWFFYFLIFSHLALLLAALLERLATAVLRYHTGLPFWRPHGVAAAQQTHRQTGWLADAHSVVTVVVVCNICATHGARCHDTLACKFLR